MSSRIHIPAPAPGTTSFTPARIGPIDALRKSRDHCPSHSESDRLPTGLAHRFGDVQIRHTAAPVVQAKLTVNDPGDKFEQEADRVADDVMRMSEPPESSDAHCCTQTPDSKVQRKCAECEEEERLQRQPIEEEDEEEELLQTKSTAPGRAGAEMGAEAPPIVRNVLRSPGQPLDRSTRRFMESRFGRDFSQVRIHADGNAAASARAVNAAAYTVGRDVVFASGAFAPMTRTGRHLLAHELVHTVQQRGGNARTPPNFLQRRTAPQQTATVLRNAVVGLGTDEEAIFNALTGRTPAELTAIQTAYREIFGGETLEDRLRSELSGDDLARAISLLGGETASAEAARTIWNAVRGIGTDEAAIYGAVAGRTPEQWTAIQADYRRIAREQLLIRLRDELTDSEYRHLQTLLPGAEGGATTPVDRATVIANQIETAVAGVGTDEEAIYAALTGHTEEELREIERRFRLLTGEDLNARLRDELNDREYDRVQQLLHPQPDPDRLARRLREAVEGPGTDESAIISVLTGRTPGQLTAIREAYQRLYGEVLRDRLQSELSGTDALEALGVEAAGVLPPEDEIRIAIAGIGTDEERLFAVLEEISSSRAVTQNTIDQYAAKGYGDMLADIRDDLSGADLNRALELLHGNTPSGNCSTDQRRQGLLAISQAVSRAQRAVAILTADIGRGNLSSAVRNALTRHFNPAGVAGTVTVALATQARDTLAATRNDILTASEVTCGTPPPCVANPSCTQYTYGWTHSLAGATVRLCPAFFSCLNEAGRARGMLHEFVHHTGVSNPNECYHYANCYSSLRPLGDGSANDSLDHADAYAGLAEELQ